jgi:ribosomal protein L22
MSAEEEKDVAAEAAEEPVAQEAERAKPKRRVRKPAAKKAAAAKETAAAAKEPDAEEPDAEKAAAKPARKRAPKAAAEKAPAEKAQAKPARSSGPGSSTRRRRVVRAHARYVRTSARKARMVCGHLRGKSVDEARAILEFTPRDVAGDWRKLLESAVANAESNHELLAEDLIVREAYADEGPTIKRFRPRAMGRATPIRKRTSHLTIALVPRPSGAAEKRKG